MYSYGKKGLPYLTSGYFTYFNQNTKKMEKVQAKRPAASGH